MHRKVLISGASGGIGRALAKRLLGAGWRVLGVGRDFAGFPYRGPNFTAVVRDLGVLDELPAALRELALSHPDVDALICAAGVGRFGSLEEFSYRQIRDLIDLNLTSQICLVRAFLPMLKRRGEGDIVLVGSEAAVTGGRRGAVYSATKFGLRGLAQALRQECSSSAVRVGIVNPGMVRSDFFEGLDFGPGPDADNAIEPDDVAAVVALMLEMRPGTVIDEVNLSPRKKVICSRRGQDH